MKITECGGDGIVEVPAETTRKVTVSCQTTYRDSETQTDPYSPPYKLNSDAQPELIKLSFMVWGAGLPPGQLEMETVLRMRNREAWAAILPPESEPDHLLWKTEMIRKVEEQEWQLREQEMAEIQEVRLQLMRELLRRQTKKYTDRVNIRLQQHWQRQSHNKQNKLDNIKNNYERTLRRQRRFFCSRLQMYPTLRTRAADNDIFTPSNTKSSSLTVHRPIKHCFPSYLNTGTGLDNLERMYGESMTRPNIKLPSTPPTYLLQKRFYRKHRVLKELNWLYDTIQSKKRFVCVPSSPPRLLVPIQRQQPPLEPPSHQLPPPDTCPRHEAARLLQRLARGRTVELRTARYLQHRRQLVDELRSTHALRYAQMLDKTCRQRSVTAAQRLRYVAEQQDRVVDEALGRIESAAIARLLALLSNELLRLQEERKIQAFCMLAEREREMREAAEAGLRQKELRRRREIDEIFKHEMAMHQSTVQQYLEDIVLESIDSVADQQARQHVRQLAAFLSHPANYNHIENEAPVLVHQWLIPEMERLQQRRDDRHTDTRRLVAARDVLFSQLQPATEVNTGTGTE